MAFKQNASWTRNRLEIERKFSLQGGSSELLSSHLSGTNCVSV